MTKVQLKEGDTLYEAVLQSDGTWQSESSVFAEELTKSYELFGTFDYGMWAPYEFRAVNAAKQRIPGIEVVSVDYEPTPEGTEN
jgi:hypothetical protein